MNHAVKCKFCAKVIIVMIDDGYQGDADALLKMAACNKCADLRVRLARTEDAIFSACRTLSITPKKKRNEVASEIRIVLEKTASAYAYLWAEFIGSSEAIYDIAFVEMLMNKSTQTAFVMKTYRDGCRKNAQTK